MPFAFKDEQGKTNRSGDVSQLDRSNKRGAPEFLEIPYTAATFSIAALRTCLVEQIRLSLFKSLTKRPPALNKTRDKSKK